MKTLTALTLALFLTTPAAAQSCRDYADFARMFMEARQQGMPLDYNLRFFDDGTLDLTEEQERNLRATMMATYDQPIEETNEAKTAAVERFAGNVDLKCGRGWK